MKYQLLVGVLASSLVLSGVGATNISCATEVVTPILQSSKTLSASPESDFTFSNGEIKKYIGTDRVVVVPDTINGQTVTSIGNNAFNTDTIIASVTLPDTITHIGNSAFHGCIIKSIVLPDSLLSIGENAFELCWLLETIHFGNSLVSIGDNAFQSCRQLVNPLLPDSLERIGEGAFSFCYELESVVIPNKISVIEEKTFYLCSGLVNLVIPDSVTEIKEKAFSGCDSLTSLNLPNSLQYIGDFALGMESVTTLNIPNSVTNIGKYAFSTMYSLESIKLPNSITTLRESTFFKCESLKFLTIPDSVISIENSVFSNCNSLESIFIPNSVTEIAYNTLHHTYNDDILPMDQVTVFGHSGSTIESWCLSKNIKFQAVTVDTYPSWVDQSVLPTQITLLTVPETTPKDEVTTVSGYSDVLTTDWFAPYVEFATNHQLLSGENGNFNPTTPSNRGTVAQALANLSKQTQNSQTPTSYTDISGSPYEKGIAWCLENGVMSGFDTSTFGTTENLTREQFATTLRAYSEKMGVYVAPSSTDLSGFGDGWSVSSWANLSVAWAVENGLMVGSEGNLNLQGNVTRAEVAVMLSSYNTMVDNMGGYPSNPTGDSVVVTEEITSIRISPEYIYLPASETVQLSAMTNLGEMNENVTWTSTNTS